MLVLQKIQAGLYTVKFPTPPGAPTFGEVPIAALPVKLIREIADQMEVAEQEKSSYWDAYGSASRLQKSLDEQFKRELLAEFDIPEGPVADAMFDVAVGYRREGQPMNHYAVYNQFTRLLPIHEAHAKVVA